MNLITALIGMELLAILAALAIYAPLWLKAIAAVITLAIGLLAFLAWLGAPRLIEEMESVEIDL